MLEENVEIVRRWLDAFEHDRNAFQELLDPEIEWAPFEESHTPSNGVEGAMRIRDQWLDTWGEHHMDLEEAVEGSDGVVASVHMTARGRASGVEVDVRLHGHFKVRRGKVVYLYEYEDRQEALEAAGLSE